MSDHNEHDRKSRTLKDRLDVLVDKTDEDEDGPRRNSEHIGAQARAQHLSRRVQAQFADDEVDRMNASDLENTIGKNQKPAMHSAIHIASSQGTLLSPTTNSQGVPSRRNTPGKGKLHTVVETMEELADKSNMKND